MQPRFDSPSLFGRLLDRRAGGSWSIAPVAPSVVERGNIDATNVLRTRFRTESGAVALTNFMPAASEEKKRQALWPEHELVRRVTGAVEEPAGGVAFREATPPATHRDSACCARRLQGTNGT